MAGDTDQTGMTQAVEMKGKCIGRDVLFLCTGTAIRAPIAQSAAIESPTARHQVLSLLIAMVNARGAAASYEACPDGPPPASATGGALHAGGGNASIIALALIAIRTHATAMTPKVPAKPAVLARNAKTKVAAN